MTRTLRFISYLSPGIPAGFYRLVAEAIASRLGIPFALTLETRASGPHPAERDPFSAGVEDVGFVCSPAYQWLRERRPAPVELVPAAPVFEDPRACGRPVYFSEVVVARAAALTRFEDLRGGVWAYNDRCSLSGYFSMLRRLEGQAAPARPFFRRVRESGSHAESLRMVISGEADAAAIDSNVLALALRSDQQLATRIRAIESWGPFPIQPVVVRAGLPRALKSRLASVLLQLHEAPVVRRGLATFGVRRFAPVTDADYRHRTRLPHARAVGGCGGRRERTPSRDYGSSTSESSKHAS